MGQPELESYFYPLLKILESGNMMTTQEIYEKIATEMNLSESIKTELTLEGNFIYRDRINWAKTHLKHAELIEWVGQSKWKISEKGKSKLESNNQLSSEKLCEITPAYKKWRDEYLSTSDSSISNIGNKKELINLTPEEQIDAVFLEFNKQLKEEIMDKIFENGSMFFERLIIDLMEKMNYGIRYDNGRAMKASNDGGIDGIINQDILGLDKICIQAKRYKKGKLIYAPVITAFSGSLSRHGVKKGIVVTTSDFTAEAHNIAREIKDSTIILINGEKLLSLMIDFGLGVSTKNTYEVKKIDIDYFSFE